jgi:hypothetical protein
MKPEAEGNSCVLHMFVPIQNFYCRRFSNIYNVLSYISLQELKIIESNITPTPYVRPSTVLLAQTVEGS